MTQHLQITVETDKRKSKSNERLGPLKFNSTLPGLPKKSRNDCEAVTNNPNVTEDYFKSTLRKVGVIKIALSRLIRRPED